VGKDESVHLERNNGRQRPGWHRAVAAPSWCRDAAR
jgi:hypothetical protein